MKFSLIGMAGISALLSIAALPYVLAQNSTDDAATGNRPFFGAHPPKGPRGGPGLRRAAPDPARIISRLDTDSDGMVSEEEFVTSQSANIDRIFERVDAAGNGLISEEEQTASSPGMRPKRPDPVERPDHPEPPVVDRAAVLACVRLSIPDFAPALEQSPAEHFASVDSNGDQQITLEELSTTMMNRAHEQFTHLDSDGNGYATAEEFSALEAARANARQITKDCMHQQQAD